MNHIYIYNFVCVCVCVCVVVCIELHCIASHHQGMRTTASKSADGQTYRVNGSKIYITNGFMSDVVILCAKTDPNAKGLLQRVYVCVC